VSGAVDANSYTADAGSGLDAQSAGALDIGASTATNVLLGASDCQTHILGGVRAKYANKTASYTVTVDDFVVSYNSAAAITNTFPDAETCLGQVYIVALQDDDGDLVVHTDGTDTFDGTNNKLTLNDAGDSVTVMATAANVYTILQISDDNKGTLTTQ